jgi:hypothetical protein
MLTTQRQMLEILLRDEHVVRSGYVLLISPQQVVG